MANESSYQLIARPVLAITTQEIGGVSLQERDQAHCFSLAIPHKGEQEFEKSILNHYGLDALPDIGMSALSKDKTGRLLRLGFDHFFLLQSAPALDQTITKTAYCTEQTDNWVMIGMTTPPPEEVNIRNGLSHICMIDLHENEFPPNKVVRTVMEHIGCVLLREQAGEWLTMAPRSSAKDFIHALTLSFRSAEQARKIKDY